MAQKRAEGNAAAWFAENLLVLLFDLKMRIDEVLAWKSLGTRLAWRLGRGSQTYMGSECQVHQSTETK